MTSTALSGASDNRAAVVLNTGAPKVTPLAASACDARLGLLDGSIAFPMLPSAASFRALS